MVAQYLYVLAEGAGLETSDLIQLYWQAMTQEALSGEVSFSVLYTPFEKENKTDKIKEANKSFAEKHPDYVQHIFTDPHGIHLLPERAESHPDQQYLLTLGFRNKEIGKTVEMSVTRKLPVFRGRKRAFSPSMEEEEETFWQNTGKRIVAAMAFIGSTKIKVALIEEYLREGEEHYLRTPHMQIPGMENMNWTPRGQGYLRLKNTNMFIPNPRSLATGPKKRRIAFAKS